MPSSLYSGEKLDIFHLYIKDESVDLIYLDQPLKSDQNYNGPSGETNPTEGKDSQAPGR